MATVGSSNLTLADWAKRVDPMGRTADVVELFAQTNSMILDMVFREGNLPVGHQVTQRSALSTPTWREFNQGVAPTKTTTVQIMEQTGMLEDYTQTDKDVAELNGNTASFRLTESKGKVQAINQEAQQTLLYGNQKLNPEEFNGLATRYNSLTGNTGGQVVSGGGAGSDNSSIWLVGWGDDTVYGIFPQGSRAGLIHENLGLQLIQGATGIDGSILRAYVDHWQWKLGLAVADFRYVVRGANIDISDLVAKSSAADLIEMMIKMYHRIFNPAGVRLVYYMNRTVFQMLDIQRRDDAVGMHYVEVDGKLTPHFRGTPIRIVDQLVETEATVS